MENKKEKKKKRSLEIIHVTCHGSEELLGCYSEATDTVFCDDGYIWVLLCFTHTTDNTRHVDSGNMCRPSGKSASHVTTDKLCRYNHLYIKVLVLSVS